MGILGVFNPVQSAGQNDGGSSDNKFKFINFGVAEFNTVTNEPDFAGAINNLVSPVNSDSLIVTENEIAVFFGVYFPSLGVSIQKTPQKVYLAVNGKGKGIYGANGNISVINSELHFLEREEIQSAGGDDFISIIENDPNSHVENLGEIGTENIIDYLNTNLTFVIDSQTWYFDLTRNGKRLIYIFTGEPGTYGNGSTPFTTDNTYLMFTEALPTQGKIEIQGILFDYRPSPSNDGGYPMLGDKALNNWINPTQFAARMTLIHPFYTLLTSWRKDVID
ncbi:hypothetical protein [Bizionia paragorgiae]|uniref:Uncharacterized protein n=1 Tax=Bizionia paragorgiae TaxID=283786 RepID=A0A1H3YP87_BIZPA|nr:hypothetical protein [Bizionia paragorgiae]SEA13011.1 hypothetical protein SAMN04487990_10714 [Bizionia paragorgiae]